MQLTTRGAAFFRAPLRAVVPNSSYDNASEDTDATRRVASGVPANCRHSSFHHERYDQAVPLFSEAAKLVRPHILFSREHLLLGAIH